jgi:2,3-bisphosphoglycerate-independent phosphoglycerate mutase
MNLDKDSKKDSKDRKHESVILLIIDGIGDLPTPKTPLQAAKKPNLDKLADEGITGLMSPLGRGIVPGSDTSHLQLLGYDPDIFYHGRGPLEALGIGMEIAHGDIAFRANLATLAENRSNANNGKKIIDRRAGRIATYEAKCFEKYLSTKIEDVQITFKHSVDHRGAVVFRGPGLSPHISDTDPHEEGQLLQSEPLDNSERARKTARIVNKYTEYASGMLRSAIENKKRKEDRQLQVNAVLLRGAGEFRQVPSMYERYNVNAACIAGGAVYKGVARYLGMDIFMLPGQETDKMLQERAYAANKAVVDYDMVFLHIKSCDNFGHDGNFKGKKEFIEKIDKHVISQLRKTGSSIIITGDHSTPVALKAHSGHEVPILIWSKNERRDSVKKFDEQSCMQGGLGHICGKDIIPMALNLINKGEKYGS